MYVNQVDRQNQGRVIQLLASDPASSSFILLPAVHAAQYCGTSLVLNALRFIGGGGGGFLALEGGGGGGAFFPVAQSGAFAF